jgi:DNA-binding beta-propeller fold protein YncE
VATILASLLSASGAGAVQDVQTFASGINSVSRLRFDSARNLFATKRGAGGGIIKFPAGSSTPTNVFVSVSNDLSAIVIDSNDNLFVADYLLGIVYKKAPVGGLTLFKSGFTNPFSLAIDPQNNIYVGELVTENVYMLTPGGVQTLYGNANLEPTAPSGPSSRLTALGFDRGGNLYCGTYGNGTGFLGPFALSYIPPGGGTGIRLPNVSQPILDFALGPFDLFYTAGYHLDRLGQLSLSGTMTPYAGTGIAGLINGPLPTSRFNSPSGVALDPVTGYLYIADWTNDAVRVVRDDVNGPTQEKRTSWGRIKWLYH